MMETTKIDGDVSAPVTVNEQIARIIEQSQEEGLRLTGEGGLLPDMIRQAVEAALHAEMSDHLGYERHSPQGRGSGNSRNGVTGKTVQTTAGPVELEVPRDLGRDVRAGHGPQGGAPADRLGRHDHVVVRQGHDDPRYR